VALRDSKSWLVLLALAAPALAQEEEPKAPDGILPIPDYQGDVHTRAFLMGDWNGERTSWAQQGFTFDLQWTQFGQGVVSGGLDTGWEFPGSLDTVVRYDGLRAKVWPGLVTLRIESRYSDSVNDDTGLILPANLDSAMPITDPPDQDLLAVITELNLVQPVSEALAIVVGKVQTLDSDPSEFASGRGRDQFFQFPMVANSVTALTVPYSTLALGVLWSPDPYLNVSSMVMNTTDSSTTSGISDMGDGTTWATELHQQYRNGKMPGGQNIGFLYAFDGDFTRLNGKLQTSPGGLTVESEASSWAAYWTGWQYFDIQGEAPDVIQAGDARPDCQGMGVFTRMGIADNETNPVEWSGSVGVGGRGLVDGREDDSWGLGYFYNALHEPRTTVLDLQDHAGGLEGFYAYQLLPAAVLTADVQWLESAFDDVDDALVLGLRMNVAL